MPKCLATDLCGLSIIPEDGTARSCPACGTYTHRWEDMGDLKKKPKGHLGVTNDGVLLMSPKLKAKFDELGVENVDYKLLASGWYAFRPLKHVFVDFSGSWVNSGDICEACYRFPRFRTNLLHIRIMEGQTPVQPFELVGSFQHIGNGNLVVPMIIAGDGLVDSIKGTALARGITFADCPQSEPHPKSGAPFNYSAPPENMLT